MNAFIVGIGHPAATGAAGRTTSLHPSQQYHLVRLTVPQRSATMQHFAQLPDETVSKWQEMVDLLAEIVHVPSALIMRVEPPNIKVFVSSESNGNPYERAETVPLNSGLYCETVMKTRRALLVPDALQDDEWKSNPDIQLGMISYLGVPISWPDGEIFGTICVLDRKRNSYNDLFLRLLLRWRDVLEADLKLFATLDKQIREREAKIQRLVDANIIGIFMWAETRIIEANDAFLHILGYEREDLLSDRVHLTELTPPDWRERDVEHWLPDLKRTGSLQPFEKEYFRKDHSRVPVLVGVAAFEKGGNQGVAFVLDLTERKRAEAEARESERRYGEIQAALAHANRVTTMGQLVASISHEVKQPIGACVTNAEAGLRWLSARSPDLGEVQSAFERIIKEATRACDVMNHIRDLVKRSPAHSERVQINEAIREVVNLTSSEAIKNSVSVRMELAEDLPLVQGERVQLQQVMLNLTINAIEAMSGVDDRPRVLTIQTSQDESTGICVTVRDSGPGIDPDYMERLFEPFYTTKDEGMGMGLSICRSIVEGHKGRLTVSDNSPQGAAFLMVLPGCGKS
ncbi:GAF domain-containing sensor histidine kinase [Paraburkholderia humisilvae]|uniref:GAF domain-containing sensor histidine kinase n=1 Tax=Paraburkholderia humisilvae TaxID=627669 RepID=UPI001FE694C7|nr:ATP-binding protein [Paraburkholderia humisilvae]